MTRAIEFLKHARECCKNHEDCDKCPIYSVLHIHYCECVANNIECMSDKEIADLVREVERWWRENGHL